MILVDAAVVEQQSQPVACEVAVTAGLTAIHDEEPHFRTFRAPTSWWMSHWVSVDDTLSNADLRSLAFDLRGLRGCATKRWPSPPRTLTITPRGRVDPDLGADRASLMLVAESQAESAVDLSRSSWDQPAASRCCSATPTTAASWATPWCCCPDAASAKTAVQGAFGAAPAQVGGAPGKPEQVGETAMIFSGTVAGKATTVLVFQRGRALATLQFESAAGDPVPDDVVTAVGQKQAEKIKAGVK